MLLNIQFIPKEEISLIWDQIEEWVKNSIGQDKSFSVEDIKAQCVSGKIDLHCIFTDKLTGFIISSIYDAPQCKCCYGLWFGGIDLAKWSPEFFEKYKSLLRLQNCKQFSFIGRTAWQRLIKADSEQSYYLFAL